MEFTQLFWASCMALIVTAMSLALRGEAIGIWRSEFGLTNEQIGWINGTAFWGFTLTMMFGGPMCDVLGLRCIIEIAFVGHLTGVILTVFAWDLGPRPSRGGSEDIWSHSCPARRSLHHLSSYAGGIEKQAATY